MKSPLVPADALVLHSPANPVEKSEFGTTAFDQVVARLTQAFDYFFVNRLGVGLAAPQIGVPTRVLVAQDFEPGPNSPMWAREVGRGAFDRLLLCNPVITERAGHLTCWETCLSQPEVIGMVVRNTWLRVEYLDETGEPRRLDASGWKARILQHEIDHLDGCLCSRHYLSGTSMSTSSYAARWRQATLREAKATLLGAEQNQSGANYFN